MRILLVEDDAVLAAGIARALRAEHFAVDVAADGEDGGHLGSTELYDAAVLDLGLPKRDGVSVLRDWRAENRGLPVLILTARDGWSEKVAGFKAGARIDCGPLTFDAQLGQFELDGLPLRLTAFEWRVLAALTLRKEIVILRGELIERVYEGDADVDSNSIEVIIGRLRKKLGAAMIETVRGRGYRLTAGAP